MIAVIRSKALWRQAFSASAIGLTGRRFGGSPSYPHGNFAHLVDYVSQFMVLQPGGIITTGTPPGVGMCMKAPIYLSEGWGIEKLGAQKHEVKAWNDQP